MSLWDHIWRLRVALATALRRKVVDLKTKRRYRIVGRPRGRRVPWNVIYDADGREIARQYRHPTKKATAGRTYTRLYVR